LPSSKCHIIVLKQKALKRKANFEESKKFKEQLQAYKREIAEKNEE
jgi:COX assembly protein 2